MRYLLYIVACILVFSCQQKKEEPEKAILEPVEIPLTPLQDSVKTAIIEIEKRDLGNMGNTVNSILVSGMEIIRLSKKDYYIQERESQETNFNNFLKSVPYMGKTEKALYTPEKLQVNKAHHAAVMNYLTEMIKKASTDKEMFKVAYYLKADTKMAHYDQLQTIYLDKDLKKVVADYNKLRIAM